MEKIGGNMTEVCKKLSEVVEIVLNPYVDQKERIEAQKLCEDFKENSPLCVQCGLNLAGKENSHIVRHFGLQLIEHCIRFRWNDLTVDEKCFIKSASMQLLLNGTHDILNEQTHIKDALSRIIVEMIKREWPQHWPDMLNELSNLCCAGETQTELVLLIFLRLAEDIVEFQNVQNQRRREIYQALTANINEIISFFLQKLKENVNLYSSQTNSKDEITKQNSVAYCRVAQAVLVTLTGFVEWVSISVIMMCDGLLFQLLCHLLSDENLQLYATECLLQVVNRKGKSEEREPLLILFSENFMNMIFKAASTAAAASLEEHNYLFLKRLCLVLTGLGSQLCSLWGTIKDVGRPTNFKMYLECILAFTEHPSQIITKYTHVLWTAFFRHEIISKDPDLLDKVLAKVISSSAAKLLKVGLPSHSDSPSCEYSRLEFDSDEEFNAFFPKMRSGVLETIRLATVLNPLLAFKYATYWLESELKKPVNSVEDCGMCTMMSSSFLQWEATSAFLECVTIKLSHAKEPRPLVEDGITLLKAVMQYETQDPLILSCALSCISALFVFLSEDSGMLSKVLDKIFSTLVFSLPGQTKATRSRAVKNVRRHACSSLVKICKLYPTLLVPCFDQIYTHVKNLFQDPEQLSQMEKCTLVEALVLINNQFNDFSKQSAFIKEILQPVSSTWLSNDVKQAFVNCQGFMSYIGLNQKPVEPSNSDIVGMNRSQIVFCVDMILAVIKRSSWPPDFEEAKSGGFVTYDQANSFILNNPAGDTIYPLLENVVHLARVLNELWLPEVYSLVCPEFKTAYEMSDSDRNNILGITNPPCIEPMTATKSPIVRMQNFLTAVHDNCYHLLGNAGPKLGNIFYSIPNLATMIVTKVFANLDVLPDYRLRPVIHILCVFLKTFIQNCPAEFYTSVLVPVLDHICPYMYQRLNNKWQILAQQAALNNIQEDENADTQEVLDDQLHRQLTKEYIDILIAVLLKRGRNVEELGDGMDAEDYSDHRPSHHDETLSDLGILIVKSELILPSIIFCIYNGLSWNDTAACAKCSQICWPVLKQLLEENMITSQEASHLLQCVLLGLQKHGQHAANQAMLLNLGLQVYEAFRSRFPEVMTEIMLQIPNCKKNDLQSFDDKILQENSSKQFSDKRKKDMFKKIVVEIIGVCIFILCSTIRTVC
ncbi:Exportin-5 [Nymphon striatum]|nr:Exportin-5 [Nymphon striatum]